MIDSTAVSTANAAKQLGVSVSWLRAQKAKGNLKPAEHWLYATGRPGGRVLWKIDAIHKWQAEQTCLFFKEQQKRAAAIETYVEQAND